MLSVLSASLAMADAEAVVRDLLARVAADHSLSGPVEIKALNSGGANYTSALFSATAGHLKLFAKVASIGEKMRKTMNAEKLYKTEQIVYNELVPAYKELLTNHERAKPFRFPKIYANLPDIGKETLVMEDLCSQGYRSPSRRDSIDWRFATFAVAKLAEFHALSFAYEREKPDEFAEIAETLKYQPPERTPENEKSMVAMFGKIIGSAVQVVKDEHKARLTELLQNRDGFTKFKSPINRTVLVHGDFRASNLMFKEQDDALDMMVVDYQLVHSASPASDLLYFTFLGTDQQFRREHHQAVLERYHEELASALQALGMDVEQEYPREIFEKEVKEMLPHMLQMSAVILPLVTVEESSAPQMSGDAEIQNIMALAPNELFAQRFQALVEDCIDWGVL